jgi:hypothetical protein
MHEVPASHCTESSAMRPGFEEPGSASVGGGAAEQGLDLDFPLVVRGTISGNWVREPVEELG